jgi:HCOMODA/2-hydroxy-3-carboxy-muconic semialdehyde decarboxylase
MSEVSLSVQAAIRELVLANRILDREGVVDALGHVSIRHPEISDRYLLSCARSPGLVTEEDILEFDLESRPIDPRDRPLFAERFIHGSIYKARSDVNAVCHNHALQLIPFSVTGTPMKPIWVMGAALGNETRVWDVREAFPNDDGMLVVNDTMGGSLADALGMSRVCLLTSHGAVVAEAGIRQTVLVSINLVTNAEILLQSSQLTLAQNRKETRYLTEAEIASMSKLIFNPRALDRMWEYWAARADNNRGAPS